MTKKEMAAELREVLIEYESRVVRLWPLADRMREYGLALTRVNDALAIRLRMLAIDLGVQAAQEDRGHAPGRALLELLESERMTADILDAK